MTEVLTTYIQPFIFFAISRTVPRTASLYQLPNIDKANADPGLRDRLNFLKLVFVNFGCIICLYFNCSQHTTLIQFVIVFLKYSRPSPPPSLRFEIPGLPLERSVFIHNLRLTHLTTDVLELLFHK